MPKLTIKLTQEQREILQQNGIDPKKYGTEALVAKMQNMIMVVEQKKDNIVGRIKSKIDSFDDVPDLHRDKLRKLKQQNKLNFVDFNKARFKSQAKSIALQEIARGNDFLSITSQQESFLLCSMFNPEEWLNNAIQVKANKLLEKEE